MLALVVGSVFLRGIKALNLDLFTKSQVTFGETGGGIANGFVGTAIMVAIATAIALPFGVLVADLRRRVRSNRSPGVSSGSPSTS